MYEFDNLDDEYQMMREESAKLMKDRNEAILNEWCKEAGVKTPIGYFNDLSKDTLTIYTNYCGWMIGKAGSIVEKYREKFEKEFHIKHYSINFVEVRGNFTNY